MGSIGNYTSFEMYRYLGFVNFGLCYHSSDRRFQASASVTPLIGCDIPLNCNAELAWNPSRRAEWLYLVARYHYGYDENQLDCASEDVFLKHMLRFGIADGRTRTLEEVGKEFNVTRERIRQIEAKALRKLRHPSRSKKLRDFLN